ncbi:hypothetical protein LguiB_016876 [Lonicera macranthoides]
MPIEMPKGLPFSVDTWSPSSMRKSYHFLTHAHKDHSQGISTHSSYPIYATSITKTLTLQHYPQLSDLLFVEIEVGQSIVIDDPYGSFTVTAFDANHCPASDQYQPKTKRRCSCNLYKHRVGAAMFLFEGNFGNILHTGDSRLTPECLQSLPEKYLGKTNKEPRFRIDYVFLDCTFGRLSLKMPTKHSAIQQVINCIWKHPSAPMVYLTCDLLGQEDILLNVYQTFGSKIYINKETNPECFEALKLTVPQILTQDSSSRFHLFDGFPKLYERAESKLMEARANLQPEPLIIRPSAQWYACEGFLPEAEKRRKEWFSEAVRDQFGVWHVCYSMHSSREELEWALRLLAPKWVVSTTPDCRAMELNYVKKNCSYSQLANNDPLWKLMDISVDAPLVAKDIFSKEDSSCSPVVEKHAEPQSQPLKVTASKREILNLSPPSKTAPVTLFGRARLGLQDPIILYEKTELPTKEQVNDCPSLIKGECEKTEIPVKLPVDDCTSCAILCRNEDVIEGGCDKSLEKKKGVDFSEMEHKKSMEIETQIRKRAAISPVGSSKGFSVNLRRLYRSMNVPVPDPLPSLVELVKGRKLAKRRFQF